MLVIAGIGSVTMVLMLLLVRQEVKRVHELPIGIPSGGEVTAPAALAIGVVGRNAYSIDGLTMALDEVKKRLVRDDGTPVSSVLIVTPAEGDFGATVLLLDAVRAAGVLRCSVETRVGTGTGPK